MKSVIFAVLLTFMSIVRSQRCGMEICKCIVDEQHDTAVLDCHNLKINGIPKYQPQDGANASILEIDLSFNMIEKVEDLAFYGMENLYRVYLRRNYLNKIEINAFGDSSRNYTTNIASMNFEGNDFINIPNVFSAFDTLPKMKAISFKNNAIGPNVASNSFHALTNLKTLNLEENKISVLADTLFRHFVQLTELRLGYNIISNMPKTLFGHSNTLSYLLVQNNQLSSIPESLPTSLKLLNLANNKICGLGDQDIAFLNTLRDLQNLNFSGNNMQAILKESFYNLKTLQVLDLSNNCFSYFSPEMFVGLIKLEALLLQRNPFLSAVDPSTFTYMTSLNYLFLYDCSLQMLTIGTSKSPYALNLGSYNGTEDFQTTDQSLPPLLMLWAYGNPFYCDCKLLPLVWFIKGRQVALDPPFTYESTVNTLSLTLKIIPVGHYLLNSVCTSPHNRHYDVVDKTMTDIPEEHLTCPDQPYYMIISSFLGLALFLGVIPVLYFLIFIYLLLKQFLKTYCKCFRPKDEE